MFGKKRIVHEMFTALYTGDEVAFEAAIDRKAGMAEVEAPEAFLDDHAEFSLGTQPIHVAARRGQVRMLMFLASLGAGVNAKCQSGMTPLHHAAAAGHEQAATYLLDNGGTVIARDNFGRTALHLAVASRKAGMVAMLLRRGASRNHPDKAGDTPLHYAAKGRFVDIVQLLITAGAKVSGTNDLRRTPLHMVILGADLHDDTPQTDATTAARTIISTLLAHGADVNALDAEMQTPLDKLVNLPSNRGGYEISQTLREAGGRWAYYKQQGDSQLDVNVEPSLSDSTLRVPDAVIKLEVKPQIIGRGNDCEIRLRHSSLSRKHAQIEPDDDGNFVVVDLGSSNGTYINEKKVKSPTRLVQGDRLLLGPYEFEFDGSGLIRKRGRLSETDIMIERGIRGE